MNHKPTSTRSFLAIAAAAAALTPFVIAGCGGGGGGGSSAPPATTINGAVEGTVDFSAGTPAANYTVKFGSAGAYSTTTNSQGAFQINFNAAVYDGSQPLTIYDTTGALIDEQTVTVNTTGGTQSLGTIVVGPPAPPTGAARRA